MKDKIEKLKEVYELKIKSTDGLIASYKSRKTEARNSGDKVGVNSFNMLIKVEQARNQAYVQALSDIDSLLD